MDHCPSELFIHVSPTKCWEMVRDRVNQEIAKQQRMGKANLPPLQPPGSVHGFEMFGFSLPAIVQVTNLGLVMKIQKCYFSFLPFFLFLKKSHWYSLTGYRSDGSK